MNSSSQKLRDAIYGPPVNNQLKPTLDVNGQNDKKFKTFGSPGHPTHSNQVTRKDLLCPEMRRRTGDSLLTSRGTQEGLVIMPSDSYDYGHLNLYCDSVEIW